MHAAADRRAGKRAKQHRGASFVEILQNCVVFNDDVFSNFTGKENAADDQLYVEHGKPLLFGKDREKGLRLVPGKLQLEVATVGQNGVSLDDILVHDEKNRVQAVMLSHLAPPVFPVALGVLYCDPAPSYTDEVYAQVASVGAPSEDLNALFRVGKTWTVEP